MQAIKPARPAGVLVLVLALLVLGVSALGGGLGLVGDPSGRAVGLPLDWLENTPFGSFLIPGVILFVVLGVLPLAAAFALWRLAEGPERQAGEHWSWSASLTVGVAALVWIAVQYAMLGNRHPVQIGLEVFVATLGVTIIGACLLPSVRRHCAR